MKECIFVIDEIDRKQVLAALGYSASNLPSEQLLSRFDELLDTVAREVKGLYVRKNIIGRDNDLVLTDAGVIDSQSFGELAASADSVAFALVTAGHEMDELLHGCNDMVDAMLLDALGSVIVEQGVELLRNELSHVLGKYVSLPFSPGYCDYPLAEQECIFTQLGDSPLGVNYHPVSFMMSPVKTISCILAVGDLPLETNPCSLCRLEMCQMRRMTGKNIAEVVA
ncbi:hypothetical protein [Desulfosediminicola flagellatus]|uniref:hypothetical protein n=1 Tax=Desulfosediminicola flagellatus TaxID=2569541 RepID=UPI0010ACA51B|nr:hypothetical protein [Desulfosediminicola flagellatus]